MLAKKQMHRLAKKLDEELGKAGKSLDDFSAEEVKEVMVALYQESYKDYKPHAKQRAFHEAGVHAKQRLFLAGNRTGKTLCACAEVAMHLTGNYPKWWKGCRYDHPIDVWVASNTGQSTRNILQEQYYIGNGDTLGFIPQHLIVRKTRQNGIADAIDTAYIKHKSGGLSTLGFKSYDQGRAKFQGTQKHIIHFDEEPPYPVYAEALMRTMGGSGMAGIANGMIIVTMTPLMGFTEMVQKFMEGINAQEVQEGKFYVQASWADNPYLDAEEKKTILSSLKPHERDAREKGNPTLGLGLVYPISDELILCDSFEIPDWWPRVYGLDFGWSNPTAALFVAHDRDNDILYCYGEYAVKELTPQQHAVELTKRGTSWIPGVYDPAGAQSAQKDGEKLVQLYRASGLRYLSKANNSKEEGIMKVLQRMQNGQLKIFNSLTKTIGELQIYSRDEKGIPKKGNDHLMDCLRYIVMSGLHIARARQQQRLGPTPAHPHSWMGM